MRSIGSNCHALLRINISHVRMVTDVGIASLTSGCPALRHVNVHGVSPHPYSCKPLPLAHYAYNFGGFSTGVYVV
jgi:hypothetical protein